MYEIDIRKKVYSFINSLENQKEIINKIRQLKYFKTNTKIHLDIKRIKDKNKNLYRLRVGEIRFIFEIFKEEKIIYIKLADYRGRIYK
jgi:mRNA-degrading endonuclease RelE of RelBE toxin-antitoxin system